eukprot:gene13481-biopygen6517
MGRGRGQWREMEGKWRKKVGKSCRPYRKWRENGGKMEGKWRKKTEKNPGGVVEGNPGPKLPAQGGQDSGAGVARAWRGRGAGCRQFSAFGVARAWRGHVLCPHRPQGSGDGLKAPATASRLRRRPQGSGDGLKAPATEGGAARVRRRGDAQGPRKAHFSPGGQFQMRPTPFPYELIRTRISLTP